MSISIKFGEVLVKHKGNREFTNAYEGEHLYSGDLLKIGEGARLIVRCSSGSEWNVPPGITVDVNNGCQPHRRRDRERDYLMLSDSDPGDVEHTAISVDYIIKGCADAEPTM